MKDEQEERYLEGEVVISSKIYSPRMIIKKLEHEKTAHGNGRFIGLRVYWWSNDDQYFETIVHAKDLKHYDKV